MNYNKMFTQKANAMFSFSFVFSFWSCRSVYLGTCLSKSEPTWSQEHLDCSLHKALLVFWSHHPTQSVIMRPQIGTARGLAPNPFKQTCPAKCPWWFWPNPQKAIFSRLWAGNTCSQPGIWSVTVQQSHKLSPTASPFSEPWQSSVAAFFWARQAVVHG